MSVRKKEDEDYPGLRLRMREEYPIREGVSEL